jgi:predicted ester cyclase
LVGLKAALRLAFDLKADRSVIMGLHITGRRLDKTVTGILNSTN